MLLLAVGVLVWGRVAPTDMVAMALTTTVITEKGGAGKTTVTLGLASAAHTVFVAAHDPEKERRRFEEQWAT